MALVASKVDHVGPDGQHALNQLLSDMLRRSRQHFQFERIEHELFAVAGIATVSGRLNDGTIVLDGYLESGQKVRVGAPSVPRNCRMISNGKRVLSFHSLYLILALPIHLYRTFGDQLLEYLLGDKLK